MSIPTKNPLASLEYTKKVAKRAQYEAFEFTLVSEGIRVRNGSYADPENHEYLVTVADGVPDTCTCPADARFEGACKHRVAVAIRRPLVDAVMVDTELAADGGLVDEPQHDDAATDSGGTTESAIEEADCAECLPEFPCWECVRTGRLGLSGME
jgi:hypothetical protein